MTAPAGEVSTGDLWRWVDRLTLPRRHRLTRSVPGGTPWVEYHDIDSLFDQLVEQQGTTSSGSSTRGKGSGSRAPLDLATTALLAELATTTVDALLSHGDQPRRRTQHIGPGGAIPVQLLDTPASLRALAVHVVGTGDADLIDWWTDKLCTWVLRAEECLDMDSEDTTTPVRGVACPSCGVDHVLVDRDAEEVRQAALTISFRDGQVRHVTCRHCLTVWWRGEGVDTLATAVADSVTADDVVLGRREPASPPDIPLPRAAHDDVVNAGLVNA